MKVNTKTQCDLFSLNIPMPTNQWKQVLYYLMLWNTFSYLDVIKDSYMIKFQSRLSEIERDHGVITVKKRKEFINRFGKKSTHVTYTCIDKEKARKLFDLY
jgi:hypothetical protein